MKFRLPKLVYCGVGIGGQAHTIYTSMICSILENRRLILINYPKKGIFGIVKRLDNTELFNVDSKRIIIKPGTYVRYFSDYFLGSFLFIMFMLSKVYNKLCLKINIRYILPNNTFICSGYQFFDLAEHGKKSKSLQITKNTTENSAVNIRKIIREEIKFYDSTLNIKEIIHEKIGIPSDKWYVCCHVRSEGFYSASENANSMRNSKIESYYKAFRHIVSKGGMVVRIGDKTMPRITEEIDGVIDYANSAYKTDLIDIHLIANCKYFLGTQSGPLDVAKLLGKTLAVANIYPTSGYYMETKGCLGIYKKCLLDDSELSLKDMLEYFYLHADPKVFFEWTDISNEIKFIDNSENEILDLVKALINPIVKNSLLSARQKEFNKFRENLFLQWLDRYIKLYGFADSLPLLNFVNTNCEGGVLEEYLKNNWQ